MEGQEHIGTHQQIKIVIRVLLMQRLHRQVGVAFSLPFQLNIRNLDTHFALHRQTQHFQPLLRGGRSGGNLLVRCDPVRDHQQQIQAKKFLCLLCSMNMSRMDGIECTAIDADFHRDSLL